MNPKNPRPGVSIVIPCWNAAAHVGAAIQSALAQRYPSVEVIVVDDGSTDQSGAVIGAFGERIRVATGPNGGACRARNKGLALARGELVQYLDADDLLYPDKLAQMVPVAVAMGPKHLAVCDWERIDLGGGAPRRQALRQVGDDTVVWCAHHGLQTASPLHWRCNLEAVGGFDEALPCAQERDLHLRLACRGLRWAHVPEVLVRVRRRAHSLSSDPLRVFRQHAAIVLRARELLAAQGGLSDARAAALAGLLARDARLFFHAGQLAEARRYWRLAREIHPGGGLQHAYHPLQRPLVRPLGAVAFEGLLVVLKVPVVLGRALATVLAMAVRRRFSQRRSPGPFHLRRRPQQRPPD
ncbi:MAG: glycosyltransferase family 2 protein [Candidatus Competibacterales bacterium]